MADIERPSLEDLRVLCYPDKRLRQKAAPLAEVDGFLSELAHRMDELMLGHEGVGLAATQVGWPHQFIIVNPTMEPGKSMALINPVIMARLFQHEIDHLEGRLFVDRVGAAGRVLLARRLKRLAEREETSATEL